MRAMLNTNIVRALLDWFARHARDLPWRRTRDPYAIWISEVMLQQTQVKTVIPYWERWMRELPDVHSLAQAGSARILKLWEGLGYYRRARHLQQAAQVIVSRHGGVFPQSFDDVLALPGIGRYTAGAICSIAFNQPVPILDGNVVRVLTRLFGLQENTEDNKTKTKLWKLAEELVKTAYQLQRDPESVSEKSNLSRSRRKEAQTCLENVPAQRSQSLLTSAPTRLQTGSAATLQRGPSPAFSGPSSLGGLCSALNQSLMELGATICTPRLARCEACPLGARCVARRKGLQELLPRLERKMETSQRRFVALVVRRRGRFLVRHRPEGVVNAGLWEFPNWEVQGLTEAAAMPELARRRLGLEVTSMQALCVIKHSITRYRITVDVYQGLFAPSPKSVISRSGNRPTRTAGAGRTKKGQGAEEEHWFTATQLERLPFTAAHRRILKLMSNYWRR
ncbi:MAG: A/G-specific adenine glycosylase [Verrucomicrobia bacterium]|nr:A/G-specific adenine glycosylase [Verrucomicrobiota bacterium]